MKYYALILAAMLFATNVMASPCGVPPVPISASFQTDSGLQDDDQVPPSSIIVEEWSVVRDPEEDKYKGNSCGQPACSPAASVGFRVSLTQNAGDETVGLIVRNIEPKTSSCRPCDEPLSAVDGWIWVSVNYSPDEDISRVFEISAVDAAGNEGAAVRVDAFSPAGNGCATGSGTSGSIWALIVVLLLFGGRYRTTPQKESRFIRDSLRS